MEQTMRTQEHEYVLGFAFQGGGVWLIRKLKPEWQRGKLNGIGGKLEGDEEPIKAMRREFREETGVDVEEDKWRKFGCLDTVHPGVARVWLFTTDLGLPERPHTQEAEEIMRIDPEELPNACHHNLRWMIPMALADTRVVAEIQEVVD